MSVTLHRTLLVACLIAACCLPATAAAGPAGHWKGSIDVPGQPLEFDVDLSVDGSTWSGDITIPAQGARDLPLENVVVNGNEVRFAIRGVPGTPTFTGTMLEDGTKVAGSFTQGDATFPFSMARGGRP